MKYCPNCGAELVGKKRFCADCGERVPETPGAPPEAAAQEEPASAAVAADVRERREAAASAAARALSSAGPGVGFAYLGAALAAGAVVVPVWTFSTQRLAVPESILGLAYRSVPSGTAPPAAGFAPAIGYAVLVAVIVAAGVFARRRSAAGVWLLGVLGVVFLAPSLAAVGWMTVTMPEPTSSGPSWAVALWLGTGVCALSAVWFATRLRRLRSAALWHYAAAAGLVVLGLALGASAAAKWDTNTPEFAALRWVQGGDIRRHLAGTLGAALAGQDTQVVITSATIVEPAVSHDETAEVGVGLKGTYRFSADTALRPLDRTITVECSRTDVSFPRFSSWFGTGAATRR